jgi:hypothetical protein
MSAYRYAVYAVPAPGHALGEVAEAWLAAEDFAELMGDARRYGFHGTLKAPFRLADGRDEEALAAAVAGLAGPAMPVLLELRDDLGFPALRPVAPVPALDALAASAVTDLDGYRAPLSPGELARRHAASLSARQSALLERWGYPYVLDEFRFHMTLGARSTDPARHAGLMRAAGEAFRPVLAAPVPLTIAIFVEPARGAAFQTWRDIPSHTASL